MLTTILRLPAVKNRTGLSRSTIYSRISQDKFPKPISLGSRAVGWVESEIEEWLSQRIDASRGKDSSDTGSVGISPGSEGWIKP